MLRDPAFWKQQAYFVIRFTLGWAAAIGELTLIAASAGALSLPIWYRWSSSSSPPSFVVPFLPLPDLKSGQPPGTAPPRAPSAAPSAQAQGATR